jgi:hypothetical protein
MMAWTKDKTLSLLEKRKRNMWDTKSQKYNNLRMLFVTDAGFNFPAVIYKGVWPVEGE